MHLYRVDALFSVVMLAIAGETPVIFIALELQGIRQVLSNGTPLRYLPYSGGGRT